MGDIPSSMSWLSSVKSLSESESITFCWESLDLGWVLESFKSRIILFLAGGVTVEGTFC